MPKDAVKLMLFQGSEVIMKHNTNMVKHMLVNR